MTREEAIKLVKEVTGMSLDWDDAHYEALQMAIEALEQQPKTWSLDDAREDFIHDVYNTLDFLPTNEEANRIIDSFDRVTSSIKQEQILDKIRDEIGEYSNNTWRPTGSSLGNAGWWACNKCIEIIDKYKEESEDI